MASTTCAPSLTKSILTPTEGVRFFHTRVPVKAGEHVLIVTFPERYGAQEGPAPNLMAAGGAALSGPVDARGFGGAALPSCSALDGKKIKEFEIAGPNPGEAVSIEAGPPTPGARRDHRPRQCRTCRRHGEPQGYPDRPAAD